jgi:predicted transcriptional regulator
MPHMGEGPTGAEQGNYAGSSGWVTTKVAAAALGVTPRTVRTYIHEGELEGREEQEGINKRLLVSISSLDELRVRRETEGRFRTQNRRSSGRGESVGESSGDMAEVIRDLSTRLEQRAAEAADLRARLELTARAESTLQEQLQRERERADKLEDAQEEAQQLREELERERGRGFWRRLFGLE